MKPEINVHVDDPVSLVAGLLHIRKRTAQVPKRSRGHVDIGEICVWTSTVAVAIKEELIRCVVSDVAEFSSVKVISEKRLRTLVGRAVHVALLFFTRPCQGKLSACTTIGGLPLPARHAREEA